MSVDQITIALFANLIRLLGAELVAGAHRDDVDILESAIRAKVNVSVVGATPERLAAATKQAHEILTPVLARIRWQAQEKNAVRAQNRRLATH